jgi:uncharacterized damage-inducible protein DinB
MPKAYRPSVVGALVDEYERAASELARIVESISDEDYEMVRAPEAEFPSIRSVLDHVVAAGYGHDGMMRKAWDMERTRWRPESFPRSAARAELQAMIDHTCATLDGKWGWTDDEIAAVQIPSRWGPVYDLEQLLEHMIVHVLRHRRQIERFLAR